MIIIERTSKKIAKCAEPKSATIFFGTQHISFGCSWL
nr:MAG TPA: hypothetical protein [Caudoviricetes sp.]